MKDSSFTAEAIAAAANHADGHRWTPTGTIEVPFTPLFPYGFGGAGKINSTVEDLARWVRLQLGNGTFEGSRIVSPENLAVTRSARVGVNDKAFYAMGWVVSLTPNGNVVWHNGGTYGFGAYIGMLLDQDVGVVILTNAHQCRLPGCGRRVGVRPAPRQSRGRSCRQYAQDRDHEVRGRGQAVREAGEPAAASPARAARRQLRQPELRQGGTAGRW